MTLNSEFKEDQELISSLCPNELARFEKWFAELNELNDKENRIYYNGQPLEKATGIKCWFDFFTEGLSPQESLDEDYESAIS